MGRMDTMESLKQVVIAEALRVSQRSEGDPPSRLPVLVAAAVGWVAAREPIFDPELFGLIDTLPYETDPEVIANEIEGLLQDVRLDEQLEQFLVLVTP